MKEQRKGLPAWPKGPSPRAARYGWAAAVSGLLALSLISEKNAAWLPLINQAIDLLQQHNSPNGNR